MRKAARVDARTAFKNGILPDENARASHLPCQPYKSLHCTFVQFLFSVYVVLPFGNKKMRGNRGLCGVSCRKGLLLL